MAGDKQMYFGTLERMSWIPCPSIEVDVSNARWSSTADFLNGGAHVRRSSTVRRTYSMNWSLQPHEKLSQLIAYDEGLYGDGPFYFLMPGMQMYNAFPQFWATPRLAVRDAPLLVGGVRPALFPASSVLPKNYPNASAHYVFDGDDENLHRDKVTIPIPEGYAMHVGIHGQYSGDAAVAYQLGSGEFHPISPIPIGNLTMTDLVIEGPQNVTFSTVGSGTLTLNSMVANIVKIGRDPVVDFFPGQGHSGVQFTDEGLSLTMYSAIKNLYHASAQFVEVGAWV